MLRLRNAALLTLAVLVVGCSSNKNKELPPAELTEFNPEVQLQEVWSRSVGEGQGDKYNLLTPAEDAGVIYVSDDEGTVVAVDENTGDVKWKKELDKPVTGGVGVGGGLVLLGTSKGEVIALSSSDGEERWHAQVSSEVLSSPATNGTVVVVQTQDDKLTGLDVATGERLWLYEDTQPVLSLRGTGAPLVTPQLAVAGFGNGKVIAVDTQRGLPIWEQRVAIPQGRSELDRVVDIDGGLLLSGNSLYVVTYHGRVAALDLMSGRPLWERDASSYVGAAEALGNVYISQESGTVEAIDERTTTTLWSNDSLARRLLSAPAVFSSYIAVGDLEGYLHLLSQVDGRFVGRIRVDKAGLRVRPLVVGDKLIVYGNGGELAAYRLR